MPTVQELKKRLEYLVDDTVEDEIALSLFNEAQEDLSEVAGYAKTATLKFDKGMSLIPAPCDLIKVVELKIKLNSDRRYSTLFPLRKIHAESYYGHPYEPCVKGYRLFGNQFELVPEPKEPGELMIHYYATLPELKDMDDIPSLDQRYHRLLPLFAASRYMQNWQGELSAKQDFYTEYLQGKMELEKDFRKKDVRTKPRGVYVLRPWA